MHLGLSAEFSVNSLGCRAAAQRQELQAAVDQLPEAGAEARHVLPGGGGDRHEPPRQDGQQVSTRADFSQFPTLL